MLLAALITSIFYLITFKLTLCIPVTHSNANVPFKFAQIPSCISFSGTSHCVNICTRAPPPQSDIQRKNHKRRATHTLCTLVPGKCSLSRPRQQRVARQQWAGRGGCGGGGRWYAAAAAAAEGPQTAGDSLAAERSRETALEGNKLQQVGLHVLVGLSCEPQFRRKKLYF